MRRFQSLTVDRTAASEPVKTEELAVSFAGLVATVLQTNYCHDTVTAGMACEAKERSILTPGVSTDEQPFGKQGGDQDRTPNAGGIDVAKC